MLNKRTSFQMFRIANFQDKRGWVGDGTHLEYHSDLIRAK